MLLERRAIYFEEKMLKKNGAHTHVRTTVQLSERNIHVGCCLFSHEQKKKNDTQNQIVLTVVCQLDRGSRSIIYRK